MCRVFCGRSSLKKKKEKHSWYINNQTRFENKFIHHKTADTHTHARTSNKTPYVLVSNQKKNKWKEKELYPSISYSQLEFPHIC